MLCGVMKCSANSKEWVVTLGNDQEFFIKVMIMNRLIRRRVDGDNVAECGGKWGHEVDFLVFDVVDEAMSDDGSW